MAACNELVGEKQIIQRLLNSLITYSYNMYVHCTIQVIREHFSNDKFTRSLYHYKCGDFRDSFLAITRSFYVHGVHTVKTRGQA